MSWAKRWKVSRTASSKSSLEVAGALGGGQSGQDSGVALGGQERGGRGGPVGGGAPGCLAPVDLAGQVGQHIGHERAGDASFEVAVGAVLEGGPGRGDRGGGVRHVVGHNLVGVDAAMGGHGGAGPVDQVLRQLDGVGRGAQRGVTEICHGARPYWLGSLPHWGPRAALPMIGDQRGQDHRDRRRGRRR